MNGRTKGVFREGLRRGLGIGTGIAMANALVFATFLYAQDMLEFVPGQVVSAGDINGNFTKLRDGMTNLNDEIEALRTDLQAMSSRVDGVETGSNTGDSNLNTSLTTSVGDLNLRLAPVGAIVAWHKNFPGIPALPANWVECNGQTISVPGSPLNGFAAPSLNNAPAPWNEGGVYLRGSLTSGGPFQSDQFQGHRHRRNPAGLPEHDTSVGGGGNAFFGGTLYPQNIIDTGDPVTGLNGVPRTGGETRPVSFRVVWIMRVQ